MPSWGGGRDPSGGEDHRREKAWDDEDGRRGKGSGRDGRRGIWWCELPVQTALTGSDGGDRRGKGSGWTAVKLNIQLGKLDSQIVMV
nr:unnamed protein product [Digitaria exilis]